MQNYLRNDEQISDGANLLISILVRYPEIGTISYRPEDNSIKFTFLLSDVNHEIEFVSLRKLLINSIYVYNTLEGRQDIFIEINLGSYERNIAMLTIIRDVKTLLKDEMALVITLLRDKLNDRLIIDSYEMYEEDLLMQEALIENMLENLKKQYVGNALIGIREDGKILVYNK